MRYLLIAVLLAAGCSSSSSTKFGGMQTDAIADVKTCGCPSTALCRDCCGKKDCRCGPTH